MKRILSLVLALSMVLSMFTFAFAGTGFTDINGTEYEAAVSALSELGIVNGYTDGSYKPEQSITRAEVAKLLVIASGKEAAANDAKGAVRFNDPVEANWSWATGYINVATQYGYVNGYPDGSFKPNNKITYSEAVTMAVRVLGYSKVVESVGSWPTNYISKGEELKLLKDVDYDLYSDEATRGNIAIILWNMLRTNMWDITSDNETNGLTSSQTRTNLIDKFFDEYEYIDEDDEATLVSIDIADNGTVDEGKVTVTVANTDIQGYTLKGGDLTKMVPGMKVVGLANTKDEEVLTLTSVDTLVEGRFDKDGKIDGKKYTFETGDPAENDYIVGILDGKKVTNYIVLPDVEAEEIIDEDDLEDRVDDDEDLEDLYLIDGAWATVEDLKVGDVISEIEDLDADITGTFYVVSRDTVKGTYNGYVAYPADDIYKVEVSKKEYETSADTKFFEYNEKDEEYKDITVEGEYAGKDNKYLDEDVKLTLDYLGNVVSVYFEEITKETASEIAWYIQTGNYWTETGKAGIKYYASLTDTNGREADYELNGEQDYGVTESTDLLKSLTAALIPDENDDLYVPAEALLELVMPLFKKDGKMYYAEEDNNGFLTTDSGDADVDPEYAFEFINDDDGILDEDTNYLVNGTKVTSSTKVITLTPVIDDDEVVALNVTVTNGPAEVKGVTNALVVVEVDVEDDVPTPAVRASYVFVAESSSTKELSYGITSGEMFIKNGTDHVVIGKTTYQVSNTDYAIEDGAAVIWTTKDEKINIKYQLRTAELNDEVVVTKVDDELITFSSGDVLDTEADEDALKDTTYVLLNAKLEKNDDNEYEVEFTSISELGEGAKYANFKKEDRVVETTINGDEVVIIIRISNVSKIDDDESLVGGIVTANPQP